MASYNGNRFPAPMFNHNFPRNSFNVNPAGNRHGMQVFQRHPNTTFRPYQRSERFMHENFQNRPHFSNFPVTMGSPRFRNRFSPPNQVFPMDSAPNFPRPLVSFDQPVRSWHHEGFRGPRPQFQNRPRAPVPSQQHRTLSMQSSKRGKTRNREFRKLKSWMTDELFAEVKKKNTLYLKAKSSDEQTAWQEFRLQRNRVSSLIKEAKLKAGLIGPKIKEDDTTVKPFSCDTCDRAFVTENELKDHISQHIKCDHENCIFEAHPKIVALHQKMQHDTGYADRINKLKDDAEVQKWREERKKRFPTAETIQKRKAEQVEKEARGEVLESKEFGKFKRRREDSGTAMNKDVRRRRNRGFKRSNERRRNFHPRSQPFTINVNLESDSDSDSHITLHRFLGMSSLANSAEEITDKVEDNEVTQSPHIDVTPISDKQLSPQKSFEQNLQKSEFDNSVSHLNVPCADGNSSKLDKDQATSVLNDDRFNGTTSNFMHEVPVDETTVMKQNDLKVEDPANESVCEIPADEVNNLKNMQVITIEDSDNEGPVAVPIVKSIENSVLDDQGLEHNKNVQEILPPTSDASTTASNVINSENGHNRNNNRYNQHPRNRHNHMNYQPNSQDSAQVARKSSLLEKLLADDIRHERNVVLQCIRHIVKKNFFGIGGKCLK